MNPKQLKDRIRGCMLGGAIGDALGYPVEFLTRKDILCKYGSSGIISYQELNDQGKAVISDDTQMTLFTANGLLFGVTRFCTHGGLGAGLKDFVRYAYMDWLQTQIGVDDYTNYHYCWIRDIAELNVQRAPGNTCMSSLIDIMHHKEVQNDSKGCGGVMRVAPVGLMAAADSTIEVKDYSGNDVPRRTWSENEVIRLGGDCAEITHKHPLGYLPAAIQAGLVYYILMSEVQISFSELESLIWKVYDDVEKEYQSQREQVALKELKRLLENAIRLAGDMFISEENAIRQLGEGWTGDEALAIAVYCALKHIDSFEQAIISAVNHDGDSDSTGAICGNLMGAIVGMDGIPDHFISQLELRSLIEDIADDLLDGCPISEYHSPSTPEEERWEKRYVKIELTNRQQFKGGLSILNEYCEYSMMPQAKQMIEYKRLLESLDAAEEYERFQIAYRMALHVFDTDSFDPYRPLPYRGLCDEPQNYSCLKGLTPAYYYGYSDSKYSPQDNYRVFKLNHLCFKEINPVIAFRADVCFENYLRAGLRPYDDKNLLNKYPGWKFYLIDRRTADGHYAVLTNQLEKEFAVEIAHLWEDGTLHRIYHLFY